LLYKAELNSKTPLYLAAHRSHSSHASHGSHRSSSGGSSYVPSTISLPSIKVSDPLGKKAKPITSYPPAANVIQKCKDSELTKRKETVKRVQMYLYLSGHYTQSTFDGVMDSTLRAAITKYKQELSLSNVANTILDASTLSSMGIACE